VIEAVMIWNEPNNKSHWDHQLDPDWSKFAKLAGLAADAIRAEQPKLVRVLGGLSPIDGSFLTKMADRGVLDRVDAVAVHGFPLDWHHWPLDEWPAKLAEIQALTKLPVWISEVGASTFGADWVQDTGLARTHAFLSGKTPRIHWYCLFDLPHSGPATSRHREVEASAFHRHFHMGVIREDGTPKPAARRLAELTPEIGVCQWFCYEDDRLDDAVRWLKQLGVRHVRTGLAWSDYGKRGRQAWFDRQMKALEPFEVTVTFCFTPEDKGIMPHPASPPRHPEEFAAFCAEMVRRYAC
jgi:beta-xylosidase